MVHYYMLCLFCGLNEFLSISSVYKTYHQHITNILFHPSESCLAEVLKVTLFTLSVLLQNKPSLLRNSLLGGNVSYVYTLQEKMKYTKAPNKSPPPRRTCFSKHFYPCCSYKDRLFIDFLFLGKLKHAINPSFITAYHIYYNLPFDQGMGISITLHPRINPH